jgi:hypothetical protein
MERRLEPGGCEPAHDAPPVHSAMPHPLTAAVEVQPGRLDQPVAGVQRLHTSSVARCCAGQRRMTDHANYNRGICWNHAGHPTARITPSVGPTPDGDPLEFFLLILGAVGGGALGFRYGQQHRPKVLAANAADAVVQLLRAAEASSLPREWVMAFEGLAHRTFDDDTAAYIKAKLRETPPAN